MKYRRRAQIGRGNTTDRLADWEGRWDTVLHVSQAKHHAPKQSPNVEGGDNAMQPPSCEPPEGCRHVRSFDDILPEYRGTPIEDLFAYHDLGASFQQHAVARLLIGTCMDNRIWLRIPPDFAYVMRVGGANLRDLEFQISLVIALRGVSAVCLIGHDDCAMTGLKGRQAAFVKGLVENAGWNRRDAQGHFDSHARFEVGDAIGFVRAEARRLSQLYPRIVVAPLFYSVVDRTLYQVER